MRPEFYPRVFVLKIALAALLLAACSGSATAPPASSPQPLSHYSPEPAAHRGGTVVMGDYEWPQRLHPLLATTQAELRVSTLLFAPLWGFDDKLQPFPTLVARLPQARGNTLDITLRPGLTWSDGQPLTVDDVIFSVDWLRSRGDPGFSQIALQERRSDTELIWHFATPPGAYLLLGLAPLPKHRLASASEVSAFAQHPDVFSGPFSLASTVSGAELVFAPNPRYGAGRAPYLDQVVSRVYGSKTAEIAALLNGDAQLGLHLLPSDLADLSGAHGSDTLTPTGLEQEYLSPNHGVDFATGRPPPWVADPPVLKALDQVLDRETLNAVAFGRVASPTAGLFPAALSDWHDAKASTPKADLGAARRTLDADGWTPGGDGVRVKNGQRLAFSLVTTCQSALRKAESDELVREWSGLGVSIQAGCRDRESLFAAGGIIEKGAFDMTLMSNTWGPDPSVWASVAASCHDAALDADFAKGGSALDMQARRPAYAAAEREWLADRCTIPLLDWPSVIQRNGRLRNFVPSPIAGLDTWNAADWWMT